MTDDLSVGIVLLEGAEESNEGSLLCGRAGVVFFTSLVEASLVADADGVLVVAPGMGADEVLVARLVHLTIAGDVVVVAGVAEARGVIFNEFLQGVGPVTARGATVNDNEVDTSHNISN